MIQISWLDPESLDFPPIESALAAPDGLLAAGGDLSRDRLLQAYRHGIFPWYEAGEPILWWSPNPCSVLFPEQLRISRSLRKNLRNAGFTVTMDQAFARVISACSGKRDYTDATWITSEMKDSYLELHNLDIAHSVEVWLDGRLVGGLYGIAMGQLFFGESMFSKESNASKVALVHLTGQLLVWGYKLIDCQVQSNHMDSLGACSIPRNDFQQYLEKFRDKQGTEGKWELDWYY